MDEKWVPIEQYQPVGGNLALDLSNTVSDRLEDEPKDKLHDYGDLLTWGERAGALDPARARKLRTNGATHPDEAAAVLMRALELRDVIYRIFSAVAASTRPSADDVARLNDFMREGAVHRVVESTEHGWRWRWEEGEQPLAQLLWPIAHAAAELLTEGDLSRVKQCRHETCSWLFIDQSKNRSRRWCDMKDCGNRVKARRHYRRTRERA